MTAKRYLIVNADDFGQSPGINRGIIRAFEHGVVTSTSLMVRWPAAAEAASYCHAHPGLSVGLHVDLGEWALNGAEWKPVYTVLTEERLDAVADEVGRQIDSFRRLVGRAPTHLDSHQHVHRREPAHAVLQDVARRLGVPLRHFTPGLTYCGSFYGQAADGAPTPEEIGVEGLLTTLKGLAPGFTELACHPGEKTGLCTMYKEERVIELRTLCDPQVRTALETLEIELFNFLLFHQTPYDPSRETTPS
jgi:predicted glycoside hydrolase/deacetylase ChbG (UPF0249 family)